MDALKRITGGIFDFLQSIVVVLAVLVMVYLFIMSPQEISGASMEPNFHNGEYILTNKIAYRLELPKRGDVIIFKSPKNKEIDYIKRIIGLPGDKVRLVNSKFYVNDLIIDESSYLPPALFTFGGSFLRENQDITVPVGHYFVAGDNRPHSSDSREFGPISLEDFIGKAFFRYFPFNRTGLITRPNLGV